MNDAKGTVLIIDDEEPIRNILSYALQKQGYVCELAKRGDEALQSILMKDFDIALLDIDMPGMSGFRGIIAAHYPSTGHLCSHGNRYPGHQGCRRSDETRCI